MSRTPIPDPWLEYRLYRDDVQPTIPRESTTTPVECPLIASQAWNLWLVSQEPIDEVIEESALEGVERILENLHEHSERPTATPLNPLPDFLGLDLQAILMVLARRPDLQPKKQNKSVKEPDLFSGSSPDELWAFIFQCQIYFQACKGEFTEDTEKIFFVISYLRGVTLDFFEPFINETDSYQNLDFLEKWPAFVQKLSNLFGSYSPEDDDKDAIVAIPFYNNGKAINYFIQFAKFQNRIRWDDRSLRKVVKDTIPNHICDELRFSHEDVSTFEGLKRAVMRIDNDFWKRHQEEKHKFQAARSMQSYLPKSPRPTQRRPSPAQDGLMPSDKAPRDRVQGSSPQTSFPSHVEPSSSTTVSFLGPDGRLTPAEC